MSARDVCGGVLHWSVSAGIERATAIGVYADDPGSGRRMCRDCDGWVLVNRDGRLRRHVRGSNLTPLPTGGVR